MKDRSLLPANRTPQERALERASNAPIVALDSEMVCKVKDPRRCPQPLLPWLAWEYAVDYWDEAWSAEQKIQTIENAAYIHRHRGTAGAVRRSLAAVGYPTRVVEWWQDKPLRQPYTFRVEVYTTGVINKQLFERIRAQTERSKNLRSYLTSIDVIAEVGDTGVHFISGAVTSHIDLTIQAG
ncbi:phage tail protein I [Izhakiella australiensis]|uniref:Phage tail protein I n=1 Tax=Izhakiella australiensis TaxID=1926881 RepID=A0A1S8YL61_9GAMM|nr:phage tail protein I [Izhakiella australiensis]